MTSFITITVRIAPVVFLAVAAAAWFNDVQAGGPYVLRNLWPLLAMVLLAGIILYRGKGTWTGAGKRLLLAAIGFAIPVLGLSSYLHYAYATNLNDLFTDALYPERLFAFLPIYTFGAGVIGFAIGWIVGRNL